MAQRTPASPDCALPLLEVPAGGVPAVISTAAELADYVTAVAGGTGPLAVDTERAAGFRYGQDAYLVQVKRDGAGIGLIDPQALPDLSSLARAAADTPWILHSAGQDLPCLQPLGMIPQQLYDTELAARMLGDQRVSLGAVVEREVGVRLAKEHSAADWSTRPLPSSWLAYAALDVELLAAVRAAQVERLRKAGKLAWAEAEFEAVRTAEPKPAKPQQWRRISHLSRVRTPRALAMARELWYERDAVARQLDIHPTRLMSDAQLLEIVQAQARTARQIKRILHSHRNLAERWLAAINRARELPFDQLPSRKVSRSGGIPDPRRWGQNHGAAHARLQAIRAAAAEVGREHNIPAEIVLAPAHQRLLAWVEIPVQTVSVRAALQEMGARPWQIALVTEPIARALRQLD